MEAISNGALLGALLGLLAQLGPIIIFISFLFGLVLGAIIMAMVRRPSREDRKFWQEVRANMRRNGHGVNQ